jgi:glycosyltransferase involved in cell wall biosynthesis
MSTADQFSGVATESLQHDKRGSRILIYSHSLPPWVDGVSFRFKQHIKMLKQEGQHVNIVTIEDQLDPAVASCAETVTHVDSTYLHWYPAKLFPNLTIRNCARIWKACVESRAEVIHCTLCPSLPMFFMCARALNIPLMISVHTDSVTLLTKCNSPWWVTDMCKVMEPLATWFADANYTVSPSYSAILLQRGIKCLDVTWGGYANSAIFHPGRKTEGNWRETLSFGHPEDFIMITAGRVSPEKDIGFLVTLVRQFRDRGEKIWLAIIGDGPAADEFKHLHGDPKTGIWFVPGFLKQTELAAVYASVDLVCSASTFETFGFTSLEAMACGTPFLGPRAQGFRDVVNHNLGGYLFDAKDLTSAAHYLELMLHERQELFPESSVLASTADFTARNCLLRTLEAYRLTKINRHNSTVAFGCDEGTHIVPRTIMKCIRAVPIIFMMFFIAVNYILLNLPHFVAAGCNALGRARRTAGATWDRRMVFTNLTRNRVLVGSQVTN